MSARRLCLTAILAVTGCSYINLDYDDGGARGGGGRVGRTVGEAVKQSVHASDGAVYPYTDACPGGLVRGVRVVPEFSAYDWVAGLQVYCGARSLAGLSITIADSGALPYRKGDEAADPEAADLICPQDQVVVSAFGSAGDVLDNLGVRCAPLVLSPTPQGYTVGAGSMTDLGPHGDGNATNFEDPCDGAMSGAYVNLGSWVNGYATLCSTIAAE